MLGVGFEPLAQIGAHRLGQARRRAPARGLCGRRATDTWRPGPRCCRRRPLSPRFRGRGALPSRSRHNRRRRPRTLEPIDRQAAILHAGGDQHRARAQLLAAVERDAEAVVARVSASTRRGMAKQVPNFIAWTCPRKTGRRPRCRSESPCNSRSGCWSRPARRSHCPRPPRRAGPRTRHRPPPPPRPGRPRR